MPETMQQIGRLAMRQEGEYWKAYYAMPGSMKRKIFLGSIRMTAIVQNENRKQAFMDMMRSIVSDIIKDMMGARPTWRGPETAPEHERAGHG